MKMKWYLSTLFVSFAFLFICLNQVSSPNQEILLQFDSEEVTTEQSANAISAIKQQLQYFGVQSFNITDSGDGELRISYHSFIDVDKIKKALSEKEFQLDFASSNQNQDKDNSKKPSKKNLRDYDLDVYELKESSDHNNSSGKYVISVKQDYDRFLNSNYFPLFHQSEFSQLFTAQKLSKVNFTDIAFVFNTTSHIIPEVRAGPAS